MLCKQNWLIKCPVRITYKTIWWLKPISSLWHIKFSQNFRKFIDFWYFSLNFVIFRFSYQIIYFKFGVFLLFFLWWSHFFNNLRSIPYFMSQIFVNPKRTYVWRCIRKVYPLPLIQTSVVICWRRQRNWKIKTLIDTMPRWSSNVVIHFDYKLRFKFQNYLKFEFEVFKKLKFYKI